MKKGFASMTIVYSFLLVFILTLLLMLALFTRKSRLVDSITMEAKDELNDIVNLPSYYFSFNNQSSDGYYTIGITEDGNYKSGNYILKLCGAQGGNAVYNQVTYAGGKGACTEGTIQMIQGETYYIHVGGQNNDKSTETQLVHIANIKYNLGGTANYSSGIGGGATDIRFSQSGETDINDKNPKGYYSRIMVAAGGGGASSIGIGGAVGGDIEGKILDLENSENFLAAIGPNSVNITNSTQDLGGKIQYNQQINDDNSGNFLYSGVSQMIANYRYPNSSWDEDVWVSFGGGGGGYYGGAGASSGGSSYISGHDGCKAVNFDSNYTLPPTHSNNSSHYSNKSFSNTIMTSGINEGHGYARLTYLGNGN